MTDRSAMPPYAPRPHQAAAIEAISGSFAARAGGDDVRARITMMCGTGKTLTAQRAVERLVEDGTLPETGRVLLLFPSLALVQQTFDSWVEQQMPGHGFRALAFCSGAKPARGSEDISAAALTMDRTTDAAALAAWLNQPDAASTLSVVFGTYQSSGNLASIHSEHATSPWDLVIADEAHNTTGDLTSVFATVLHQDQIPARHRLFMTATPKVHTKRGRKVADASDLGVASMSDETVYGPKIYDYSMPQAIADGVLNDYEVVILGVTDSEVRAYIEEHPEALAGIAEDARQDEVLAAIALLKAAKGFGLSRVLTFHRTIARAESFAAHLPAIAESFPAEHLHTPDVQALAVKGADPAEHRDAVLTALADTGNDQFTAVSNCKVFAEGVDAPTLDGELIADARTSPTEVTQIVGRVIRLNKMREGKSVIVLPVLDDETLDIHDRLNTSSFDKVWQTILALAEHDIEMQADLDRLRRRAAREVIATADAAAPDRCTGATQQESHGPSPDDEQEQATASPEQVADEGQTLRKVALRVGEGVDAAAVLAAFEARVVDTCVDDFEQRLAVLVAFLSAHGRAPRSSPLAPLHERSLGHWLSGRRFEDKRGVLSAERRTLLAKALDPLLGCWNPDREVVKTRVRRNWNDMADMLERFYVEHGSWPRRTSQVDEEAALGNWLNAQRTSHKRGAMPAERRQRLDVIGDWAASRDDKFQTSLAEVLAWAAAHGGRLPSGTASSTVERRLGTWLAQARSKVRTGISTGARAGLLVEAGLLTEDEVPFETHEPVAA